MNPPPEESDESLRRFMEEVVRTLSRQEGRRVCGPGHAPAVRSLEYLMESVGLEPFHDSGFPFASSVSHPATGAPLELRNLAGMLRGSPGNGRPILLGAHYDSAIDSPCSDDNTSSIAVILAAVLTLRRTGLNRDIAVVFFDAEERPFFGTEVMGSEVFCRHWLSRLDPALAIVLDVVGYRFSSGSPVVDRLIPGIRELFFVTGSESDTRLPGMVSSADRHAGGMRLIPVLNRYVGDVSDHGAFRRRGLPYLFLSAGRRRVHHTPEDLPSGISTLRLEQVLGLLLDLVGLADEGLERRAPDKIDQVGFEIEMLRRAAGWILGPVLFLLGIPFPETRSDLDAIAGQISRLLDR